MRLKIDATLDYYLPQPHDVLLAIEAAPGTDQRLIEDGLTIIGAGPLRTVAGEEGIGRRTLMLAEGGRWQARYHGIFEVDRAPPRLEGRARGMARDVPGEVLPYLWPSRYCEADRFTGFVHREFGQYEGGDKVIAMADWIREHVDYVCGSSDTNTTAVDCFVQRAGVCRDFAHLLASLARADGIPARLVSAYAYGLELPDFHAVVEVWLDGAWHLVDATGLARPEAMVRIAVGRDATDIAFMTVFGSANLNAQQVRVERVE
jgi:transglutaminase-like putative cysteine protease